MTAEFTIYGHTAVCRIFKEHGMGTRDVEVLSCVSCPGLVGRCFRMTGLPL